MKGRLWILIVLFMLIAVIGVYTGLFHGFNINEKTRQFLVDTLSDVLHAEVSAESVSILPWSIRINSVSINPASSPAKLHIRRLRIGFNIFTLWFNRHRPLYGAREIFFDHPEIIWMLDDLVGEQNSVIRSGFSGADSTGLTAADFPLNRITISDGSFLFSRGDSTLVFASRISGWLDGYKSTIVDLNVEGNVLSDKTNMSCRGSIDTIDNLITVDFSAEDCNLAFPGIELLTGGLDPESGALDLAVHAEKQGGKMTVSGEYRVENGAVRLIDTGIRVSDLAIAGTLDENKVLFDVVTGSIWGVTSSVTGSVALRPEPAIDLKLEAPGIELSRALENIVSGHEVYPTGSLDLTASLQGPLRDMRTQARVTLDSLIFRDVRMKDLALDITHSGNEIFISRIEAVYDGWMVTGQGRSVGATGVGAKDVAVSLDALRQDKPGERISVDLSGKANPGAAAYYADYTLDSSYLPMPVTGSVSYGNDTIELSGRDDNFRLESVLSDLGSLPRIETVLELSECPVLHYAGSGDGGLVLDGKLEVAGDVDSLGFSTGLRVDWGKNLHAYLMGSGEAENVLRRSRRVQGSARLMDFSVRYAHPESWEVTVRSDSLGVATLLSDREGSSLAVSLVPETGDISGTLDLNEFPLEWIVDIFIREEFSHKGRISGIAVVDGTLDNPSFRTPEPLHVRNMTLAGIHRLEGMTRVSGSPGRLAFSDVNISRDGIPALHADGLWESGSPFILDVSGDDVELGAIEDVISSSRRTQGRTNYDMRLVFTRRSGTIDGTFSVENGYFFDIPFDSATAKMNGGSSGFSVTDFAIEKDGIYSGTGRGTSGYFWKNTTGERGLKMDLDLKGDLIRALPSLTGALNEATGDCGAELSFGGTWQDPVLFGGTLVITNGTIRPSFLLDEITDIEAELVIEPNVETASGLLAATVTRGIGTALGKQLIVDNVHVGTPEWERIARPGLTSIPNENANLDFGIIRGRIARGDTRDSALRLHIPGFMRPGETGIFEMSGLEGNRFFVGASETGDNLSPYIAGSISVLSGDINYPLLEDEEEDSGDSDKASGDFPENGQTDTDFLEDVYWDLQVNSGSNVNYVKEHNLEFGGFAGTTLWRNEIKIDENSTFHVSGRLADQSLRVTGNARSTYGEVTYYGYNFDIEWVELELDTANILKPAILTGRARTIVFDDSTGVEDEIFLHVNFVDRESGRITEARGSIMSIDDDYYDSNRPQTRFDAGELGMLEIRFSSNNPALNTQNKILARLGLSVGKLGAAATRAITSGIDHYYFNPLLRPFEERIKRVTRLDMVKITPSFLGNFAQSQLGYYGSYYPSTNHVLFDRSRVTFGEYFLKDWFISYTGQYGVGRDYLSRTEKGFYHDVGLQYLLERNIRLQLKWNYDEIIREDDTRIQLRYDFSFD